MTKRIDYARVSPETVKALSALQAAVNDSGLELSLLELVKLRVSQINRCAYCIDMHTKEALAAGETPQRLFLLDAWRESPMYTERERAALLWAEVLTDIATRGVPDEVYEQVRPHFEAKELVDLTMALVAINGWNRLAIGFQSDVGGYQPRPRGQASGSTKR